MATVKPPRPGLARRSSLRADVRLILLASWAFLLQVFCSWRLTPKLLEPANDDRHQP